MTRKSINKVVILTGAGISAESGISTFRDSNGLWENHRIEEVASPEGFRNNPNLVYEFYNKRRAQLLSDQIAPNSAHDALTKLQNNFEGEVIIITQNIDDLHERSGTKNTIHMHGELLKMRCQETGKVFEIRNDFDETTLCDCCSAQGNLRPHIVWFGEMPENMHNIQNHLTSADLFLSIGTSGLVYPAALFVQWTPKECIKIEFNLDATDISTHFNQNIIGLAGIEVVKFIDNFLSST